MGQAICVARLWVWLAPYGSCCVKACRDAACVTVEQVSGSILRRFLTYWAKNAVLAKVHALLVAMLRGNPL